MPDKDSLTICFTGRRPKDLCGYEKEKYSKFVKELESKLKTICQDAGKPVRFISGGAQGFDQLAFWSVDLLKKDNPGLNVKNIVYVPFKGQEKAWFGNSEDLFSPGNYKKMLSKADNVVYLKGEIKDRDAVTAALLSRNHNMVDDSDYVIALYPDDDWQTKKRSGTSECMRYAYSNNKDILQLKYDFDDDGCITMESSSQNVIKSSAEDEAEPEDEIEFV